MFLKWFVGLSRWLIASFSVYNHTFCCHSSTIVVVSEQMLLTVVLLLGLLLLIYNMTDHGNGQELAG